MNRQEQTNIINDLAAFVKDHREDQFGEHESLYYEILKQWRQLSRFDMDNADPASRELADHYWTAMGEWHQRFTEARGRISDPAPMPSIDLQEYYEALIAELADDVIANLPPLRSSSVIRINDFARRLNLQLGAMEDLYTDMMLPIDLILLVEYWRLINRVVHSQEGEE